MTSKKKLLKLNTYNKFNKIKRKGRNKFLKLAKNRKFDRTQRKNKDDLARKKVQKTILPNRCKICGKKLQHHHFFCDKHWLKRNRDLSITQE